MSKTLQKSWIITEGIAGTENPCIGVAEALGIQTDIKKISLKEPWKMLSPYLGFETSTIFSPKLVPPWPDLLITSGRKSIAAARYIKRKNGNKTFALHIQDPRVSHKIFDLIAVPQHDPARGANIITTQATPNRITHTKLNDEKEKFPHFSAMPSPRIAILIGGNSKAYKMRTHTTKKIITQLSALDGSIMMTASRRTGEENRALLKNAFHKPGAYFWDGDGENPYFALLGWADYILVTSDSTSMISEACTTGKPVYMLPLEGGHPRIDAFHKTLISSGILKVFSGTLETWKYPSLNEAETVAGEVRKRMIAKGWIL